MSKLMFRTAAIATGVLLLSAAQVGTPAVSATQPVARTTPVQVFAHRGGRKWAPENTMSAFRKSVESGVDGIELDIHRCKSGELIVIHDDTVDRTTNGKGAVKDLTLTELKALDAGSWYAPEFKNERLPLLSEVLSMVDGRVIVNIEIKNLPTNYAGIDDALLELLSRYKHTDKIIISSFDHAVLHRIQEKAPQYRLAMLDASNPYNIDQYAKTVGVKDWNPHFDCVRQDTVQNAHNGKLGVYTWTANDPKEWDRVSAIGVDGIITDDPVGLMSWRKSK